MGGRNGIVDLSAACIRDRLPTRFGISHPGVPLLEIIRFTLAWINQEITGRTGRIPECERLIVNRAKIVEENWRNWE